MDIDALESTFPARASEAFATARAAALSAGLCVLEAKDGVLIQVWPDGRRVEVKAIALPTTVTVGMKYRLHETT
jgi:uncharacterized membrane protein